MSNTVYHGGRLDLAIKEYGGKRKDWLDLSTGINPNAYPARMLDADIWRRLPDGQDLDDLLRAAKRYYRVPDGTGIVAAGGTQALIELLPHVLVSKRVAIVSPTYGEHAHTWRKCGAHIETIKKGEAIPRLSNALLVVNPNNPDANVYSPKELITLAKDMSQHNGYLIVDEAFCDPTPENSIIPELPKNVIVYRSFGKFFGLAGLRLGFLVGPSSVVQQLENMLGPWCVSGPALEIGRVALGDKKWIKATRRSLEAMAKSQAEMMAGNSLDICGINPLFIYGGHEKASSVFKRLAENKILVRPFPEISNRLRFGLCKDEQALSRLDKALKSVVDQV
jgi:cobalamin biosynthetic protein CobC